MSLELLRTRWTLPFLQHHFLVERVVILYLQINHCIHSPTIPYLFLTKLTIYVRPSQNFALMPMRKKDGDGNKVIQVASFYTEKTSEFLLLMENSFDGVRLGSATTVNSPK